MQNFSNPKIFFWLNSEFFLKQIDSKLLSSPTNFRPKIRICIDIGITNLLNCVLMPKSSDAIITVILYLDRRQISSSSRWEKVFDEKFSEKM